MAQTVGYDSYEETVTNGDSISSPIEIDARQADRAFVYVDDGSGSAIGETYELSLEVKKTMPHDSNTDTAWLPLEVSVTGSSDRLHEITSFPPSINARLTLDNDGAAGQNFRIVFETVRDGS